MRYYSTCALGVVGLCALLVFGCVFHPDLEGVEQIIARELEPARLETSVRLELGPGLASLAKLVSNWTDVEEEARECVAEIRRVELGVYKIKGHSYTRPIRSSKSIRKRLERAGWEMLAKVKEEDEM